MTQSKLLTQMGLLLLCASLPTCASEPSTSDDSTALDPTGSSSLGPEESTSSVGTPTPANGSSKPPNTEPMGSSPSEPASAGAGPDSEDPEPTQPVEPPSGPSGGSATSGSAPSDGSSGAGGSDVAGEAGAGGTQATGGVAATGGTTSGTAGASTGGVTEPSSGCQGGQWTPGDETITLMHDGIEREHELHIPASYTGGEPVPLMLVIHGAHNTPQMARNWSQMDGVSDENGFIITYPAGLDCWNTGSVLPGCTAADDDIGFLSSLVEDVQSKACIDAKRVYATGISNGAMMAQTMGCERADIFAAVGGVAGPTGGGCNPSRPITVTYFHGTEDSTVGFGSAEGNVEGWATRNGCVGSPVETYNEGSTQCLTYQECDAGVEVLFCAITGMGHCWPEDTSCGPGGGPEYGVTDFEASPMMWSFFERHPLPL